LQQVWCKWSSLQVAGLRGVGDRVGISLAHGSYDERRYADAVAGDSTGTVILSLWDDMIDNYSQQVKYREPLLLFHQEGGQLRNVSAVAGPVFKQIMFR
jgi:hypothetical protein